ALSRLETMIQMTGMRLSERAMRQQIASALDVVLQVARLSDGTRRVTSISEITGMEGDTVTMQEIFQYERTGIDSSGKVTGRFRATGICLFSLMAGMLAGLAASVMTISLVVIVACGLFGAFIPFIHVFWKRKKRLEKFLEHLPDALELMSRALSAGHAFSEALHMVS